jgi:hypothetical protein
MRGTERLRLNCLQVKTLVGLFALPTLAACGSGTHTVTAARGFLAGEIFIIGVPTPPYGPPSPAGTITVLSPGNPTASEKVVARVQLRSGEHFRVELPAGSYMIAAEVKHKSSCAPWPTSVAPNMTSSLPVLVGCGRK